MSKLLPRKIFYAITILSTALLNTDPILASTITPQETTKLTPEREVTLNPFKFNYIKEKPIISILDNILMQNWSHVPGVYQPEYIGIHNIILGQIKRKIQHQAEDNLLKAWNTGNMSYSEFIKQNEEINSDYNPYGNWWERSWIYSLPPEKGGAPYETIKQQIGWEIKIPTYIPIVGWFKKQFNKLGDIWIDTEYQFDKNKPLIDQTPRDTKIKSADIGLEQNWRWFESGFYHFRFKPILKFTSNTDLTLIDEIAAKVSIELFTKQKTNHFATVNFYIKHCFTNYNTSFQIAIQILSF